MWLWWWCKKVGYTNEPKSVDKVAAWKVGTKVIRQAVLGESTTILVKVFKFPIDQHMVTLVYNVFCLWHVTCLLSDYNFVFFISSFLTITITHADRSCSLYYNKESQAPDIEQLILVYSRLATTAVPCIYNPQAGLHSTDFSSSGTRKL